MVAANPMTRWLAVHTGGELDDPDLPDERRPQPDDPNRRAPRY